MIRKRKPTQFKSMEELKEWIDKEIQNDIDKEKDPVKRMYKMVRKDVSLLESHVFMMQAKYGIILEFRVMPPLEAPNPYGDIKDILSIDKAIRKVKR